MSLSTALKNQGYTKEEVVDIVNEMHDAVLAGADPEQVLEEYGLEPDYVLEILTLYRV